MEAAAPKIYDIQLVINAIEVDGNAAKVLCIECCGTRMFLGTAEGFLLEYFITDQKSKTFFSRVRQVNVNKGQPVVQIRNASALETLIILAGGNLIMSDSQSLEPKGNQVTTVSSFAVDENPGDVDPFSVSLCIAKRKSIVLAQAKEKGFSFLREISLDALAVSLAIEAGLCCVALSTGKYVFVDTTAQKKAMQPLCEFDPKEVLPRVIHVGKEEFLVVGPGGLGVFVTSRGTSERPPIIWPEKLHQLVVEGVNVLGIGNNGVYVSSLSDPGTSNLISFPGAKCLANSEGKLYVGTARSLYRFIPISVDEQVDALLSSEKVEQAFSLLEMANVKADKKEFLFRKIHRKAVFQRMAELDLLGCKESIACSGIDLREVVSLFPKILPSTTVFTRALPSLHEFADVHQMTNRDEQKVSLLASFVLDILMSKEAMPDSKDLSTAALKLGAKYNVSKYTLLLENVHNMAIDFEDCLEWMENECMHNSSALLFRAKGDTSRALEVWMRLLTEENDSVGESSALMEVIIDTLLSSNDDHLVWEYFHKILKLDEKKALEIFTKRKPSPLFQPVEIAEKLSFNRILCILYLTDCVYEKRLNDEDLHTFLASLYVDEILTNPPNLEDLRDNFRKFLIESNRLKVQFLIGKLSSSKLRLELAILHGKAGDHAPALKIIVDELQDHSFAREYCKKILDKAQRENAFVNLFKTYLRESSNSQLNENCIAVLMDFVEDFDISEILPLLPDDLSLSVVSIVLRRAVRVKCHKERQAKLIQGLASRVSNDYKIGADAYNQGYVLDEGSVCGVCWRKLDSFEPIFHKGGLVMHSKCI